MLSHFGKQQLKPIQSRYCNEIDLMFAILYNITSSVCWKQNFHPVLISLLPCHTVFARTFFSLKEAGTIPAESQGTVWSIHPLVRHSSEETKREQPGMIGMKTTGNSCLSKI